MARPCSELVAQLNVIKRDHTELNQQIEAVSNSESMDTSAKILFLRCIYEKRKNIVGVTGEIFQEVIIDTLLNHNADELDINEIGQIISYLKIMTENKKPLNKKELVFLYRTESDIKYLTNKQLKEMKGIINVRDMKTDLSLVSGFEPAVITVIFEEFMLYGSNPPKLHYGDISMPKLFGASDMKFPENLIGDLNLSSLHSVNGIVLPKKIHGSLSLTNLTSIEGLELPEDIYGNLSLNSIESASGLVFPKEINGSLYLHSLLSSTGLKLPKVIGGSLLLTGLESLKGLILPDFVGGIVYLKSNSVTDVEDMAELEKKYPNHIFRF